MKKGSACRRDAGVEACIQAELHGEWSQTLVAQLAIDWDVSVSAIHEWHAEALRTLRRLMGSDLHQEREQLLWRLDQCYRVAMARRLVRRLVVRGEVQEFSDHVPDVPAAVSAIREHCRILGLDDVGAQAWEEDRLARMSPPEIAEWMEARAQEIRTQSGNAGEQVH